MGRVDFLSRVSWPGLVGKVCRTASRKTGIITCWHSYIRPNFVLQDLLMRVPGVFVTDKRYIASMKNRSVPTDTVLPHIFYQDVADAVDWLTRVFGFREHYRYGDPGGPVSGAQMHLGGAWIMLKRVREGCKTPAQLGYGTQSLTVFVDDVDAHFSKAKSEGAKIVEDLQVTVYGERQYGVEDLGGHRWLFSQHAWDLSPDEWGAQIAQS